MRRAAAESMVRGRVAVCVCAGRPLASPHPPTTMADAAAVADLLADIRDALAEPLPDLVSDGSGGGVLVGAARGAFPTPTPLT